MIEIIPIKNLNAEITVPGSKYVANRVLIICALANGTSIIKNLPNNEDISNAITALKQFGVKIKKEKGGLVINGTDGKLKLPEEIDVGESGTLMRFITGFAALASGNTQIIGSKRIQERPLKELLESLKDIGIGFESVDNHPPIIIQGGNLKAGTTRIKGNISSQFISSLLLIAPYAKKDVEIIIESELVSKNYVDMTIDLMEEFGVKVEREGYKKFVVKSNQKYVGKEYIVPSDFNSASYFMAAAAIIPGTIKINNMDIRSKLEE